MKKFVFFYLLLITFAYSEIADVSFVVKGGYAPLGYYTESLSGSLSYTEQTTLTNSLTAFLELQSRSKSLDNFYYGAGIGYIGDGTLGKALLGNTLLGVDYYPLYFFLQYEPESEHYFDFLMYLSFRTGLSYEKDKGRLSGSTGFGSTFSTMSPYFGFSWGFEKNGIIVEAFYDFNYGASANLTDLGDAQLGDSIIMQTRRIGVNVGYRFNSGYR